MHWPWRLSITCQSQFRTALCADSSFENQSVRLRVANIGCRISHRGGEQSPRSFGGRLLPADVDASVPHERVGGSDTSSSGTAAGSQRNAINLSVHLSRIARLPCRRRRRISQIFCGRTARFYRALLSVNSSVACTTSQQTCIRECA